MNWIVLPLALLTALSTTAGGLFALRLSKELTTVIALTGGIVVAVALFHVLPESIEIVDDPQRVGFLVGAGFAAFFLAERFLVLHHRDTEEEVRAHSQVGALGAGALCVHSFIDGLGIGVAFNIDNATGLLVFVAVIGSLLTISEESLGELLALYAGFFLFMGATDLLPHAHEHPSWRRVALTLAGFAAILAVSYVAAD